MKNVIEAVGLVKFVYRSIGGLTPKEAEREVKAAPPKNSTSPGSPEAVELVVSKAEGYPFFLQAFANASWNHAVASPITAEDANVATGVTRTSLDTGFYRSRWERATSGQRDYLHAIALEGETLVPTRSVAQRLEKRPNEVTNIRDQLIRKGTHLCARTRLRHLTPCPAWTNSSTANDQTRHCTKLHGLPPSYRSDTTETLTRTQRNRDAH